MSSPLRTAAAMASLVMTMLGGAACASPADATPDDGAQQGDDALVGGKPASTAAFPATVYIGGDCTAAKVAPKRLLTAAHCVLDPATVAIRYAPGSRISVSRAPGKAAADVRASADVVVAAVHVHPAWIKACEDAYCAASSVTARLDAADVAVIELATELEDVPVAAVSAAPLAAGDRVTLIGFGCTVGVLVPDSRSQVTLSYADSRIVPAGRAVHAGSAVLASDVAQVNGIYALTAGPGASRSRAGLCPGDSGGPLYKKSGAALVVVGVSSNYTLAPEEKDQVGLPITNWHTRLDESSRHGVAAWLRSVGVPTL